MSLYRHIALKTKLGDAPFRYLGVIDDKNSEWKGYLTYSTDNVLTSNAKFALENGPDDLVHIRSCRNNKYWARSSADGTWIAAEVDELETDKRAWNCTLFKMNIGAYNTTTFLHVQSQTTVSIRNSTFLSIDPAATIGAVSTLIDYDAFVVLPQLVAFKGDNGLFYTQQCHRFGKFESNDIGHQDIMWSITTTNDGYISIQHYDDCCNNSQWGRTYTRIKSIISFNPDTITQIEILDETNPRDQLFSVVKVDGNVIALRCLSNNKFCARGVVSVTTTSTFKFEDVLTVSASNIIKEAYLHVIEPVLSRRVQVFEFDRDNARIYDITPLSTLEAVFENPTNVEQTAQLDMKITTTTTSTWTNSINVQLGVKTTFETGVPFIAKGAIEVSASASYGYQWQDSVQEMQQMGSVYTVKVPPMTRVVGQGLATKGTCDVPFSYVQIDKLTNGETLKKKLNDGFFTGVSNYNFNYKVEYFPITGDQIKSLAEPINTRYTPNLVIYSFCVLILVIFAKYYLT